MPVRCCVCEGPEAGDEVSCCLCTYGINDINTDCSVRTLQGGPCANRCCKFEACWCCLWSVKPRDQRLRSCRICGVFEDSSRDCVVTGSPLCSNIYRNLCCMHSCWFGCKKTCKCCCKSMKKLRSDYDKLDMDEDDREECSAFIVVQLATGCGAIWLYADKIYEKFLAQDVDTPCSTFERDDDTCKNAAHGCTVTTVTQSNHTMYKPCNEVSVGAEQLAGTALGAHQCHVCYNLDDPPADCVDECADANLLAQVASYDEPPEWVAWRAGGCDCREFPPDPDVPGIAQGCMQSWRCVSLNISNEQVRCRVAKMYILQPSSCSHVSLDSSLHANDDASYLHVVPFQVDADPGLQSTGSEATISSTFDAITVVHVAAIAICCAALVMMCALLVLCFFNTSFMHTHACCVYHRRYAVHRRNSRSNRRAQPSQHAAAKVKTDESIPGKRVLRVGGCGGHAEENGETRVEERSPLAV